MNARIIDISSLEKLDNFAKEFSQSIKAGDLIFLNGDLGTGKTTFVQMLMRHLGFQVKVKSPTYAIYEAYKNDKYSIFHMDLYRLSSAEELYYLGIEEIITPENIVLIEWADKGEKVLPNATKQLNFNLSNAKNREITLN